MVGLEALRAIAFDGGRPETGRATADLGDETAALGDDEKVDVKREADALRTRRCAAPHGKDILGAASPVSGLRSWSARFANCSKDRYPSWPCGRSLRSAAAHRSRARRRVSFAISTSVSLSLPHSELAPSEAAVLHEDSPLSRSRAAKPFSRAVSAVSERACAALSCAANEVQPKSGEKRESDGERSLLRKPFLLPGRSSRNGEDNGCMSLAFAWRSPLCAGLKLGKDVQLAAMSRREDCTLKMGLVSLSS